MKRSLLKNIRGQSGYSLLELCVTMGVLAILVMGTIPMAQNAVKRQKEQELRETLRRIRSAIDEFKRDTYGACPQGAITTGNPTTQNFAQNAPTDPRTRVVVDDCTIFDSQNLDRYPPTIDTLVSGVKVKPRAPSLISGSGLAAGSKQATDIVEDQDVTKIYLAELPVDPMTGKSDWGFRSSYQPADSESWDEINLFDVHSTSTEESLNGEKYSDW